MKKTNASMLCFREESKWNRSRRREIATLNMREISACSKPLYIMHEAITVSVDYTLESQNGIEASNANNLKNDMRMTYGT